MPAKELVTISPAPANLKAYYRFESGALTTDSSGNGHTLVPLAAPATVQYLIVGGGGCSPVLTRTGGGGAGGVLQGTGMAVTAGNYPIVVGAHGTATATAADAQGQDSSFNSLTAKGGGIGGRTEAATVGGSGGGGGSFSFGNQKTGAAGTAGQGSSGGTSTADSANGSGGGGAGGAGTAGTSTIGGNGGAGLSTTITGSTVWFAGGGYGRNSGTPAANDASLGWGGGGENSTALEGKDGVVIIRYLTAALGTCTGGTKTTDGAYTIHTFALADSGTNFVVVLREPAEDASGKFGGAASFNGYCAFSTTDHADFKPTGNFTIIGWAKTSTAAWAVLFQSWAVNTSKWAGIALRLNASGYADFIIGKNTGVGAGDLGEIAGSVNLADGNLHFIVGTWDGSHMNLYVDGNSAASPFAWANAPAYQATNYVRVGCGNDTGTNVSFLTGSLDDVFLLNGTAWTAEEVKGIYIGWKKYNGTSNTLVKTINGTAVGSIKTFNGI